jgi:hypothetical protein
MNFARSLMHGLGSTLFWRIAVSFGWKVPLQLPRNCPAIAQLLPCDIIEYPTPSNSLFKKDVICGLQLALHH